MIFPTAKHLKRCLKTPVITPKVRYTFPRPKLMGDKPVVRRKG